ncbi:DUF6221 family protein [Streptomyces bobili]|uniref:DUF6221 family protein n=1 Tax=Streptomyces bobili TaxID=67280 RepID=UPI0033D94611
MDDLVQWLRAQLDEDERIARAAEGDPVFDGTGIVVERNLAPGFPDRVAGLISPVATHIARHDPARVLREIDAKRQALDHYEECARAGKGGVAAYRMAAGAVAMQIAIMALPYADRPGYREEWRP